MDSATSLAIARRTRIDASGAAKSGTSLAIAVDPIRLNSVTTVRVWVISLATVRMLRRLTIPDHFQPTVIIVTSLAIWLEIVRILAGEKLATSAENKVTLAVIAPRPKFEKNFIHVIYFFLLFFFLCTTKILCNLICYLNGID